MILLDLICFMSPVHLPAFLSAFVLCKWDATRMLCAAIVNTDRAEAANQTV